MTNNPKIGEDPKIFIIEKPFEINKEQCRKHFYSNKNKHKREKYFKNHNNKKEIILQQYYNFMNSNKIHIKFFEWFEQHYLTTINALKNNFKWQQTQERLNLNILL